MLIIIKMNTNGTITDDVFVDLLNTNNINIEIPKIRTEYPDTRALNDILSVVVEYIENATALDISSDLYILEYQTSFVRESAILLYYISKINFHALIYT
jgi:hypothetical protein